MYPHVTPSVVAVTLVLLLVSLSRLALSQRLPLRDEDLFILQMLNPESVPDTKLLPDGAETKDYVFKDTRKFFYFLVEEDSAPVAITVTPCAAQLNWTLSLMDLPEDGSGSSDDQLSEQRPRRHPNARTGTVVKTYTGYDVSNYVTYNSPAGIYTLAIRSPEKGTSVMIYATTTPDSDHLYPELPIDPRLDITSFRKNRVSLAWKPSPSDVIYREPIIYCLALSPKRNYHTWCSVQSCLYGDRPPAMLADSGFGFDFEKTERRDHRRERTRGQGSKPRDSDEINEDIIVECVGKKTLHTFTNLEPEKRYYFDLFAVDETNNRSVAYMGTSIITRPGPPTRKHITLKDGNLRTSSVRRSSPVKTFSFSVGETVKDVLVTVQPCTEAVTAEVWREGTKIRSSNIRDLKDFRVRDVTGDIQIKIKSLRRGSTHFRIFATTRPNKYPFPRMPEDKHIKVFENLRQCDSVQLAWLSTKEVSQYCLYKKEDKQKKRSKSSRAENTQCHEPEMRKRTEKVICMNISGSDLEGDVLMETVSGLTPGTTYVFDVYVSSFGKQTLAYRSARVTTKKLC